MTWFCRENMTISMRFFLTVIAYKIGKISMVSLNFDILLIMVYLSFFIINFTLYYWAFYNRNYFWLFLSKIVNCRLCFKSKKKRKKVNSFGRKKLKKIIVIICKTLNNTKIPLIIKNLRILSIKCQNLKIPLIIF